MDGIPFNLDTILAWSAIGFRENQSLSVRIDVIAVLIFLFDFWKKPQIRILSLIAFSLLMIWVKHPLTNEVTVVDVGQGR